MDHPNSLTDKRIPLYIQAAESLKQGKFSIDIPTVPPDEIGVLGMSLQELAHTLETRYQELRHLTDITAEINAGLLLDDVLENLYKNFRGFIPYNRIGFSLLQDNGKRVQAYWAKSDAHDIKLHKGFSAPMAGSSLQVIFDTGKPRIINDLVEYLSKKPSSESTRLIVEEGLRSSLTCPLIVNSVPIGFMFFSSAQPHTYDHVHVQTYENIAHALSVIVEKGRLVSDLAEQKKEIEVQNFQLRRLNEMKNSFLGMAAHDLRNPLASIRMLSEFLLEPADSLSEKDRYSFLNDIIAQTGYMLALLNDLLDVTQIESGTFKLSPMQFSMPWFLAEVVSRHAKLAEAKRTHVILEPVATGDIVADPQRLRQVLDNLLSNGVKYSPPGSTVTVRALRQTDRWKVEVHDQGPGISEKDKEKLFQDFTKLSAKPTGGEKSTGLGLAITRRVVAAHGGKISVESVHGKGATFWFVIPDATM